MRKWFIFLSTILLSVFIVVRIQQENQQLQFLSYNAVDIVGRSGNSELSSREEFIDALNSLAVHTDSVIARRIVEPQENGKVKFVYEVYGDGSLPKGWERASKVSAETSDLVNSYLIVSGSLTSDKLAEVIEQEGYSTWISSGYSIYYSIYSLLMSEEFLISIVLCLLTFVSLTLIYRIKDLRSAGIRRVSGQSFAKIIFLPLTTDGVILGLTYLINASLAVSILFYLQLLNTITLSILLLSIALFVVTLFFLSLSLSLVYVLGLKVITLVEVLKGKLPLKRLLTLMLLGQLASILVVGWTVNRTLIHYNELQMVEKGVEGWDRNKDYYQASYSYGAAFNGEMSKEEQNRQYVKTPS
ncbi:hypothetical protein K6969_10790 [Streptococcus suis]|uniref:hypothetical protein n=1 Tax=Streptococcus suis TaxID=1307 RepID=UPI002AAB8E7F|nr:hypothetical protein [Streptococcus suis]QZT29137.1 hypothetical protein K6969_10790 [Streptococcus suis]